MINITALNITLNKVKCLHAQQFLRTEQARKKRKTTY